MSKASHVEFKHDILTYMVEVARGNVPGAEPFGAFGELTTAGAVTNHLIWPVAGTPALNVPPDPGVQMTIVSTSAQDGVGGTGIRSIHIHYLDGNLDDQNEEVILNGTTPVTTVATDIRFVQCAHLETYGSGKAAAGNITISSGGITYSYIATGSVRCSSSARRVPRGKTAFVHALWAGSASGTAAAASTIRIGSSFIANHDYTEDGIIIPYASISVQDGSEALTLMEVIPFPEGTVIGMTTTTDKAATISGGWAGWIEDN